MSYKNYQKVIKIDQKVIKKWSKLCQKWSKLLSKVQKHQKRQFMILATVFKIGDKKKLFIFFWQIFMKKINFLMVAIVFAKVGIIFREILCKFWWFLTSKPFILRRKHVVSTTTPKNRCHFRHKLRFLHDFCTLFAHKFHLKHEEKGHFGAIFWKSSRKRVGGNWVKFLIKFWTTLKKKVSKQYVVVIGTLGQHTPKNGVFWWFWTVNPRVTTTLVTLQEFRPIVTKNAAREESSVDHRECAKVCYLNNKIFYNLVKIFYNFIKFLSSSLVFLVAQIASSR